MKVKASVLMALNAPWTTETIDIDEPASGEVKVKMAFSGMCHSDEHLRTGDISQDPQVLQFLSGRDTMFPIVGGHEGSGVVESVGPNVTGLKPGARGIGYVPQDGALFPSMTVAEHLGFALVVRRWTPEAIRVRMEAYEKSTRPLIEYFRTRWNLVTISAEGTPEEIFARTLDALKIPNTGVASGGACSK